MFSTDSSQSPSKSLTVYCQNWQADPETHKAIQGHKNDQNNLEKWEQSWKTHISNVKTEYKAIVIRTIDTYIHIDQWDRI